MTEQEIEEGNKLITTFLNWVTNDCGTYFTPKGQVFCPDEIVFHTSWDWLMIAVQKIALECGEYEGIKKLSITSDISKVYEEVITYLKWKSNKLARFTTKNNVINTYIIKTSQLGHTIQVYKVKTNVLKSAFPELDILFGASARWESTSIDDLREGALTLGLTFEYELLIDCKEGDTLQASTYKEDYFARYGNY